MFQRAIQFGLVAGLIIAILYLLIHLIDYTIQFGTWFGLLMLVVSITFLVIGGLRVRKSLGGFITLKNAFLSIWVIAISMMVVTSLYNIVMFQVVSPVFDGDGEYTEMGVELRDQAIENAVGMMEMFGANDSVIDDALPEVIKSVDDQLSRQFSLGGVFVGIIIGAIINAVIAIIIAAIIKRRDESAPMIDTTEE